MLYLVVVHLHVAHVVFVVVGWALILMHTVVFVCISEI